MLPCSSLVSTRVKSLLADCSADWNIAGRSWWDESGWQWVCLSSLLLIFFSPHQLGMNISSGDIGLQQQDGVEMQLHHLSRPLSSFHPSIPHTFHVVIEFGWLPVPWITFPPGSLFSLSAGRISHSLSPPPPLFLSFSFHISFLLSFISLSSSQCKAHRIFLWLSIPLYLSLTFPCPSLCTGGIIGAPLSPILWFLKALLPHRGEKVTASSFFDFSDMVLGR